MERVLRAYALRRPRWAKRQNQEAERPRPLPHILSGIELDMHLDAIQREGFEPAQDTIAEDPLKPSPFDAGAHLYHLLTASTQPACVLVTDMASAVLEVHRDLP